MKTHYEVLEISPDASIEDIKHSFRHQIARYHPDKVQHLGRDLQDLAATRTAELTEAYRVLSNPDQRRLYDQTLESARAAIADQAPGATQGARSPAVPPPAAPCEAEGPAGSNPFLQDRRRRDDVVRRASVDRLRHALLAELGDAEQPAVRGFDLACVPRSKLFSRQHHPRMLGRFVGRVDGPSLIEARTHAAGWTGEEVCVFLIGAEMAPARELAEAAAQRPRSAARTSRVLVVPVDARDWSALVPNGAPPVVRAVVGRLRAGGLS